MSVTDPYVVTLAPHVHAFVQPDGGWCLNNAGFEGLPLPRTIVSTHHHGDHTYGNGVFLPQARIVGPR